jgi:iron only hydrogenase large subunit-like protein
MQSFASLYQRVAGACVRNELDAEMERIGALPDIDEHQLSCLLHPQDQPPVFCVADCPCTEEEKRACDKVCEFDAVSRDKNGNLVIDKENCVGCGDCIKACKTGNLTDRKDIVPIFELLNGKTTPVYAMIAPSYISQFSAEVTPGKLRSAFKKLGFAGMIEVALFADILTLKEALEFDRAITSEEDFMLTSCCCPIWIAMIKKVYATLVPHLPPSVSPMVACGRAIKLLYPESKTVFIGPCVAKKAEAKESDVADAVDHVLTFVEMRDILEIAKIDPGKLDDDVRDHSSSAGIIYARKAGVSEAVEKTLRKLRPERTIQIIARQADGVPGCRALLADIMDGRIGANFIEGMGCVGGCVGGPKALIDREDAARHVNAYGKQALYETPAENPYVIELLGRLGLDTVEKLLEDNSIFTRNFEVKA